MSTNSPVPLGWIGVNTPWQIELYAQQKDQSGKPVQSGGVEMCTIQKASSTLCDANPKSGNSGIMYMMSDDCPVAWASIMIQVIGNTSATSSNATGLANELALVTSSASTTTGAVQYYDPYCNLHISPTPPSNSNPNPSPVYPGSILACEHPGNITATINGITSNFTCIDGHCEIGIE